MNKERKTEEERMKEHKKMMLPLAVSSVLMFISLFFGPKIGAIGMLIWLIALVWTMNKTLFAKYSVADYEKQNDKLMRESFKNKKYVESGVRVLAFPMMGIGLIVVVINLIIMFFYL